jgi:elongation factor Ts
MQVAATDPKYLVDADIPAEVREAAVAVFKEEVADKPADMQEKILAGKMASYFRDSVLMEQPFIKDDSITIAQLSEQLTAKVGEKVEVGDFYRLQLGAKA